MCKAEEGENSPQISITKGSATNTIDAIMLHLTINGRFVNSYPTQLKAVKIFHIGNLASCKF